MVFLPFFRRPPLLSRVRRQLYHLSVTVPKLLSISYSLSGRRDSNSRPIAWKAIALPTELLPQWSEKRDSNSRPQPWQGCALPTELLSRFYFFFLISFFSFFNKLISSPVIINPFFPDSKVPDKTFLIISFFFIVYFASPHGFEPWTYRLTGDCSNR